MEIEVTTYEIKRVPVKGTKIEIPDEPFYCFQTGVRRSIRIIPDFYEHDCPQKGQVYQLIVTCVYQSFERRAEKFTILLSELDSLIRGKSLSEEEKNKASIIEMIRKKDYYLRDKERFEIDLNAVLESFKSESRY